MQSRVGRSALILGTCFPGKQHLLESRSTFCSLSHCFWSSAFRGVLRLCLTGACWDTATGPWREASGSGAEAAGVCARAPAGSGRPVSRWLLPHGVLRTRPGWALRCLSGCLSPATPARLPRAASRCGSKCGDPHFSEGVATRGRGKAGSGKTLGRARRPGVGVCSPSPARAEGPPTEFLHGGLFTWRLKPRGRPCLRLGSWHFPVTQTDVGRSTQDAGRPSFP